MPLYEFQCKQCGAKDEVFTRSVQSDPKAPPCPNLNSGGEHQMRRIISMFAKHLTVADQLAEAEAKWGKEVDAAMGPEPDIGKYARRYGELAKNLPAPNDV